MPVTSLGEVIGSYSGLYIISIEGGSLVMVFSSKTPSHVSGNSKINPGLNSRRTFNMTEWIDLSTCGDADISLSAPAKISNRLPKSVSVRISLRCMCTQRYSDSRSATTLWRKLDTLSLASGSLIAAPIQPARRAADNMLLSSIHFPAFLPRIGCPLPPSSAEPSRCVASPCPSGEHANLVRAHWVARRHEQRPAPIGAGRLESG